MKKNLLFLVMIAGAVIALNAQTADAVVRSSRDRIKAATVSTRSKMTITAKNGTSSERVVDQYSKDGPKGARAMIVFQSPASVAGTRFLTMANPGKDDDRWIYLPSLGKSRRVAASEGSGSFMGTDFSYDDISSTSRSADLDTHTLVREEEYNGVICHVIESIPKDSSYQYSKMNQWITKDNLITVKIELYDKKNTLVKTAEMSGIKDIQGRLTVTVTKMTTHAAGTFTTLTNEITKYDDPVPEKVFTVEFLETGRS
ncbi:MAG: outer membrane lipoprotein-sorting protein [Treponema sp.]|jgi:outer membrane lipoprotein-sorting protein|nr:outer membrane lipoprotein-sorting protein [Treponema sp.]